MPTTAAKTVKSLVLTDTQFHSVPYETTDIRTSIPLLESVEPNIVIKALSTLAKYADQKDSNVEYLFKNGIVTKLLDLLIYSELTIVRFTLKLLAQIVTVSAEAAVQMTFDEFRTSVKQVTYLFMTSQDSFVKEFSVQFLAHVVNDSKIAFSLLKYGIVLPVFSVLTSSDDPDTQFYSLRLFFNVLGAHEAPSVVPYVPDFSPKTLLCYIRHSILEIRLESMKIVHRLISWKNQRVQELFRDERIVENLLELVLDEKYKELHKLMFDTGKICVECAPTANYFIKSVEFLEFCQWAKNCPKKVIASAATILTSLTKDNSLLQVLFDFSVEDTILSFFRSDSENVYYRVCVAISNLSCHRYCCHKMVTPAVIKCILKMLNRHNIPFNPFHEIAYKTLLDLMKRQGRTVNYIVGCGGAEPLIEAVLRESDCYSMEGLYNLIYIFYIFASNAQHKLAIMTPLVFKMLLTRYSELNDYSNLALLILDQYIDIGEYRQYYLEYDGPQEVVKVITSTPNEELLKNTLLHLQRVCAYKNIGLVFVWQGGLKTLEHFTQEIKDEIPLIGRLINTIYNLYLPLKFQKTGHLEVTDHLTSRFYVVKGRCKEFPFLEILDKVRACLKNIIYVVDFSANVDELIRASVELPDSLDESSANVPIAPKSSKMKQPGILKAPSATKPPKSASQIHEPSLNIIKGPLTCTVDAPINYGFLSEDPFLPMYVHKLRKKIYEDEKYVLCFQHQIKTVALFVSDVLSGSPHFNSEAGQQHILNVHLSALREKLGTNLIPLGFLRHGLHCERSLLFKALAERLQIPCSLCRGTQEGNNVIYWNEVPIVCNEEFENMGDDLHTYMALGVVDLINNVGELMMVGSVKANQYCGLKVNISYATPAKICLENILKRA